MLVVFSLMTSPFGTISYHFFFQNFPTFLQLKNHLISLFRPHSCSIFGIHDPISLRHLFQLRVGLSKLREHKKRHNFADTTSNKCLCKTGVENTDHYLLQCPFYNSLRTNLRTNVLSILSRNELNLDFSSNLLLYGHDTLSYQDNRDILLATLEFILTSNRFNWFPALHSSPLPPFCF